MASDRIVFGAAALPEPDPAWLAAAERLPLASVWQGGHVLPPSATGEAVTRVALMTAWTERLRIGSAVLVLPLYQPVLVAKQLADLDARSGGRLTVGVGVGGEFPDEFAAVGVPRAERGARTDEAMDVLRALWSGKPVTHHGRFFDLDGIELRPVAPPSADALGAPAPGGTGGSAGPPAAGGDATIPLAGATTSSTAVRPTASSGVAQPGMQSGGPPLVVSGRKEPAMRRAARRGDGWMPYLVSPDAYARSVGTIRREAETAGRDLAGFEWLLYLYCSVRSDGDRARDDVASFLGRGYGDKPGAMLDRIAPAGTPEEVAAKVQPYVDAGARHIVISPAAHEDTFEVVRLAAEEVLPRLEVPA